METQPQLLLLQKTMLVAEGVGRKLDPESNMWMLSEPLIADWMRENRGPEARLRELAADAARLAERLPRYLSKLDALTEMVSADGVRLHPETVDAFRGKGRASGWRWLAWVAFGLILGAMLAANFL